MEPSEAAYLALLLCPEIVGVFLAFEFEKEARETKAFLAKRAEESKLSPEGAS